jgi:hypothetical protein
MYSYNYETYLAMEQECSLRRADEEVIMGRQQQRVGWKDAEDATRGGVKKS